MLKFIFQTFAWFFKLKWIVDIHSVSVLSIINFNKKHFLRNKIHIKISSFPTEFSSTWWTERHTQIIFLLLDFVIFILKNLIFFWTQQILQSSRSSKESVNYFIIHTDTNNVLLIRVGWENRSENFHLASIKTTWPKCNFSTYSKSYLPIILMRKPSLVYFLM